MELFAGMLLLPFLLLFGLERVSGDVPSEGCYWTAGCSFPVVDGCGAGMTAVMKSGDCNGLCSGSDYRCPFYATHFKCCKILQPVDTGRCEHCSKKIDVGNDSWVCCSDCSEPTIMDGKETVGYCDSGATLSSEKKIKPSFDWVAGEWSSCSAKCGTAGKRTRSVSCVASFSGKNARTKEVDLNLCIDKARPPPSEEHCDGEPCLGKNSGTGREGHSGARHMSWWIILLITMACATTLAAAAYGAFLLHQKRKQSEHGFVYVMLEGYS